MTDYALILAALTVVGIFVWLFWPVEGDDA